MHAGRSRDAARAVRAMARRAAARDRRVRPAGLVRVAAWRRLASGLPGVRLVAALRSAGGRRARTSASAAWQRAASRGRRGRVRHLRAVARRAVGVTRVRGDERGLARVAVLAQGLRVRAPRSRAACGTPRRRRRPRARRCRRRRPSRGSSCTRRRRRRGSSPWGAWQVTHAPGVAVLDLDVLVASHARRRGLGRERAARGSSCRPRAPAPAFAASVVFSPWQPMHARSPPATKSWGRGSRCTRRGRPDAAPRAAHGTTRTPSRPRPPAAWARWQSRHPFEPACAPCFVARSSWQLVQSAGTMDGVVVQAVALRAVGRGVLHDGGRSPSGLRVAADARRRGQPGREHVAGQAVGRARVPGRRDVRRPSPWRGTSRRRPCRGS